MDNHSESRGIVARLSRVVSPAKRGFFYSSLARAPTLESRGTGSQVERGNQVHNGSCSECYPTPSGWKWWIGILYPGALHRATLLLRPFRAHSLRERGTVARLSRVVSPALAGLLFTARWRSHRLWRVGLLVLRLNVGTRSIGRLNFRISHPFRVEMMDWYSLSRCAAPGYPLAPFQGESAQRAGVL